MNKKFLIAALVFGVVGCSKNKTEAPRSSSIETTPTPVPASAAKKNEEKPVAPSETPNPATEERKIQPPKAAPNAAAAATPTTVQQRTVQPGVKTKTLDADY